MRNLLTQEFKTADVADIDSALIKGGNMLLRIYPKEEVTAGGLHLTEAAQMVRDAAWVIGLSPEAKEQGFEIGDTVVCPTDSMCRYTEIKDVDVRYVRCEDVLAHWKGDGNG